MNIVLVGFMGTGKTCISKELTKLCEMRYISTDEMIEQKEGRSINDIFKEKDERYFRDVERSVVKEVSNLDGVVIDAGGGVMIDEENVKVLKSNGIIFCLQSDPSVILERMKDEKNRPLLNVDDKLAKIKELLSKRASYYERADHFIDTTDFNVERITKQIIGIFKS
ncbi:MAG: shikimate kinase [Candidatus Saelkia tenebricola]|nr:shikimate kinase [Candidatus Saelkia tenebricola]